MVRIITNRFYNNLPEEKKSFIRKIMEFHQNQFQKYTHLTIKIYLLWKAIARWKMSKVRRREKKTSSSGKLFVLQIKILSLKYGMFTAMRNKTIISEVFFGFWVWTIAWISLKKYNIIIVAQNDCIFSIKNTQRVWRYD